MTPQLLTVAETAAALHCSASTVKRHIESGALQYVNLGTASHRIVRIAPDALQAFVNAKTEERRKLTKRKKMKGVIQFYQ